MTRDEEQKQLIKIVETWRLSEYPEYRGFRCASCQQYKNETWCHWLNSNNYKLSVHICNDTCEPQFQEKIIQVAESKKHIVNRETFGNSYPFSDATKSRLRDIVTLWPEYKKPELKVFICDECGKELDMDNDGQRKGYHVWWKMGDGLTLAELHFHKDCGHKLEIYSKEEGKFFL